MTLVTWYQLVNETYNNSNATTTDVWNFEQNLLEPYKLSYSTTFDLPINGIAAPLLVILTIITNCLVCVVLLERHMRTPTNVLLVAIAVADTLTGVCPFPCFVYFFSAEHYKDYVPYFWCYAYIYLCGKIF